MKLSVLNSGSDGNCIIVTDSKGNQIMLDCGIKYESILPKVDLLNLNCICISHYHSDHIKGLSGFKKFYIPTYEPENIENGKLIDTPNWKILPMHVIHNADCYSYLIYSKVDRKKIFYLTDSTTMPKINGADVAIIECNWMASVLEKLSMERIIEQKGYLNHLSDEQVLDYLESAEWEPKVLILSHLSNSGLVNREKLLKKFKNKAENVFLALPQVEVEC